MISENMIWKPLTIKWATLVYLHPISVNTVFYKVQYVFFYSTSQGAHENVVF